MPKSQTTLLIVDDNPDNLRVLSSILNNQGYRVRKAVGGEMALETVRAEKPDLILLDIKMPLMDGYEVCSILKSQPETQAIPIIFLSALDDAANKVQAFEIGGADYITKPFQTAEVLIRISHQLTIQEQQRQLNAHNQRLRQEIQERQQAQAETQLLLDTIQAVNQAENFSSALQKVLGLVQHVSHSDYSEAWVLNGTDSAMRLSQSCYDAMDLYLVQFHQASAPLTFAYNTESLGQVWTLPIEGADAGADGRIPDFLRPELAIAAKFQTAFGVPILVDAQVLAILIFFSRAQQPYEPRLLELVKGVALQLGSFMQRRQAEEALKQANSELQRLANLDGLTQVANRRCFDETLSQEWLRLRREQAPLALIFCDIDYFKPYNDYYGHQMGDVCLKQVAQAIAGASKRPADLVARYGGEEFAVLLPNTNLDGAITLAQFIQEEIARLAIPHKKSLVKPFITISMGIVSIIPTLEAMPDQLMAAADEALYVAKDQGRNVYHFSQTLLPQRIR